MSMNSSFIYGYGFSCTCDETSVRRFIKNHKEIFCQSDKEYMQYQELIDDVGNHLDLEEFFADYECETNGLSGIGAVIANIMSRETGIRFLYAVADDECGTEASVVFEQGLPWNFNEVEQKLTEDRLEEICKGYCKELHINNAPDFLALEYYG